MAIARSTFTIWIAASPTLLEAAVITTKSFGVTRPKVTSAPYAVRYCIQIAAA